MIAAVAAELLRLPRMVEKDLAGAHVAGNLGPQDECTEVVADFGNLKTRATLFRVPINS